MSDPQGPGPGALDPHHHHHHHHPYSFIPPPTSKPYQNGISSSDLTNSHITLLKSSPLPPSWLPPPSEQDHRPLSDTFSEMRYLELNNWDLNNYSEGLTARLVDARSIESDTQINYRPWEKPDSSTPQPQPQTPTTQSNGHVKQENGVSSTNSPENKSPPTLTPLQNAFPTFSDTFQPPQKLPSFQSQFNAFTDQPHVEQPSLPSFHTLPATRYPPPHPPPQIQHAMVPANVLTHRDPQPFLEDRHIQLFPTQVQIPQHHHHHNFPTAIIATTQNGSTHPPPTYHVQMNGSNTYTPVIPSTSTQTPVSMTPTTTLQLQELVPVPHTLLHPTAINVPRTLNSTDGSIPGLNLNIIDTHAHFPQPQQNGNINLIPKYLPTDPQQTHVIAVKLQPYDPHHHNHTPQQKQEKQNGHNNGTSPPNQPAPQQPQTPKRQGKRKRHDQTPQQNGHDPHQVSSVSSTEPGFKRPNLNGNGITKHMNGNGHSNGHHDASDGLDKPVKKKRKRCGECIGCQRKDNCGECAPCRNDKSHQICKQRRCDKLTEKKTPKSKLKNQQIQQHH